MSHESVPCRAVSPEVDGSADGIGAGGGLSRFFFFFFFLFLPSYQVPYTLPEF